MVSVVGFEPAIALSESQRCYPVTLYQQKGAISVGTANLPHQ